MMVQVCKRASQRDEVTSAIVASEEANTSEDYDAEVQLEKDPFGRHKRYNYLPTYICKPKNLLLIPG